MFILLLQILAVLLLAAAGTFLARRLSHRPRAWPFAYLLSVTPILLLLLGRRIPRLAFLFPFSWITRTDVTYLIMAAALPLLFVTLLPRLRTRGQRIAITVLMVVMVVYYSVLPVLLPWAARGYIARQPTAVDRHGVCRQSHDFSCGPAAAVTALRHLGIPAEEAPLGLAAGTAPVEGTDARDLARAINRLYGPQGAHAEYRWLNADLQRLQQATPAIVSLRSAALNRHYVTILHAGPAGVTIGDPLTGSYTLARDEFLPAWDGAAITLTRP